MGGPTVGWVRRHADFTEVVKLAVIAGDRLPPKRLHHLDRFVGDRGAVCEASAQYFELLRPVADPYTEDEAMLRQQVEGDQNVRGCPSPER